MTIIIILFSKEKKNILGLEFKHFSLSITFWFHVYIQFRNEISREPVTLSQATDIKDERFVRNNVKFRSQNKTCITQFESMEMYVTLHSNENKGTCT